MNNNNVDTASDTSREGTYKWVIEALDPDQLSKAKKHFGQLTLTGKTVVLLWGLRAYVLLMVLLVAFQICSALHGG